MKKLLLTLLVVCPSLTWSYIAVIDWGTAFNSVLYDSQGNALTSSGFTFQLGTFYDTGNNTVFVPDDTNFGSWATHWKVFDTAVYDENNGYFSSGLSTNSYMYNDGTSAGTGATSGFDFSNRPAYIWIYNQQNPQPWVSEWFLARVDDWVFPDKVNLEDCCGDNINLQWSLSSDFGNPSTVTVVWGAHSSRSYEGGGEWTVDPPPFLVQTYTLIPEPGTWVMVGIFGGTALLIFRRRQGDRR